MIQQTPVHKRLKQNAMKFNKLLAELDGMKFMDLESKEFYEITGYQNSLRTDIKLELYNSQAEYAADEFLYVTLEDSLVETAIAAMYAHGLVPVVTIPAQEESEDDETSSSEEDCDCPICAAENGLQVETIDSLSDFLELLIKMERGQ